MKKKLKILLVGASILIVVLLCAGMIAGNYLYNFALVPATDRTVFLEADHNQINDTIVREIEPEISDDEWFETTDYQELYLVADFDGITLHAYQIEQEQQTDKWAILVHGYTGDAIHMIRSARHFYDMGYNILIPNARGHGKSEGGYIGMGWHDRLDFVQWANEIIAVSPFSQIVLYGVSMGGATVMMVSGEDLPENIKVIVEDCGYSSVWGEFSYQLTGIFGLPEFPFINFASLVTKIRAGYFFGEASAVEQVAKSETPIMFIHGTDDTFVPYEMVYEVYEAATVEKKLLIVEGAAHGSAARVLGAEYWDEVDSFIDNFVD